MHLRFHYCFSGYIVASHLSVIWLTCTNSELHLHQNSVTSATFSRSLFVMRGGRIPVLENVTLFVLQSNFLLL